MMLRRLFLALTPCAGAGFLPAWAQSASWQTIAGPNGRYSVEMPVPVQQRTSNGPYGGTTHQSVFAWEGGALDFAVYDAMQAEGPDRPPTDLPVLLADMQRAIEARWPGSTVEQQSDVQLGPAQGRSFTLRIDGGARALVGRVYYNDSRVYEALALVKAGEANGPIVTRFLNSLRITS
jgi:hypothetical protein